VGPSPDTPVCLPLPSASCSYILSAVETLSVGEEMKPSDLIKETVGTYEKHGWQLRRVLLRPETSAELRADPGYLPQGTAQPKEGLIDALWFSRASHERREAWELRLLAENPFALFETFEEDETEEQREEMRSEMEARLRNHVNNIVTKS